MPVYRRFAIGASAALAAVTLAGCGGDGPPSGASDVQAGTASERTVDYELARMSTLGLREAFLTLTGRSDGKTTAIVDFYVPRTEDARDDLYPVAIREGGCAAPGAVVHDLGRLSAMVSVVVLDASIDQLAEELEAGEASLVIQAPDGERSAWCGPLPA